MSAPPPEAAWWWDAFSLSKPILFAVMAICYPCLKYHVDIVQLLSKSDFVECWLWRIFSLMRLFPEKKGRFFIVVALSLLLEIAMQVCFHFLKKQSPSLQWCFIYPTESFDVNDIVSAKFLSKINNSKPLGFLPWFLLISFFLQLPLSFNNWNWWDPANPLSANYSALDMIQFYCVNNNAVYKYFDVQKK